MVTRPAILGRPERRPYVQSDGLFSKLLSNNELLYRNYQVIIKKSRS